MANISSINGNPIVLGASGIEDGAIPNAKLAQSGGVLSDVDMIKDAIFRYYDYEPVWELGGINLNGSLYQRSDRIRIQTPLYCKAGSKFSVPSDYVLFLAVYDTDSTADWTLLEYQSNSSTRTKVSEHDGYVRIIIGRVGNPDLTSLISETAEQLTASWYGGRSWDGGSASEIKTVKDYGAVGDGVSDDTAALNTAFNSSENGDIKIPEGTYLVSGTLRVPSNCHIYGDGSNSIIKLADHPELDSWTWRGVARTAIMIIPATSSGCTLENFVIEGQGTEHTNKQDGLLIMGSSHRIENMTIREIDWFFDEWVEEVRTNDAYHYAFGCYIINATDVHISGGHFYNCSYECIGTEECENVSINNVRIGTACRVPLQIHRNSKHVAVDGCFIYLEAFANAGTTGLTMHGTSDAPVENVYISNCTIPSFLRGVEGGENNIFIKSCVIEGAVYNSNGYYDENWLIAGCVINNRVNLHADNVSIVGCVIMGDGTNAITIDGNNAQQVGNVFPRSGAINIVGH